MRKLVSVIVPVFNVSEFLPRCLDSIINQTYNNLEIFVIDDGSTDSSGEICEDYAKIDSRIKVIHKQNGGLSDARNVAIDLAKGEYITFIDSDDWVSKFYLENLVRAIEIDDSDISVSWFKKVKTRNIKRPEPNNRLKDYRLLDTKECLEMLLHQDFIETSARGKLYKKKLFNTLRYPYGELYEDILVTYECIKLSKKIASIKNIDYFYFQRANSIQNTPFNPKKFDGINHFETLIKDIQLKFPSLTQVALCRYFSFINNLIFQITNKQDSEYKKFLWNKIKKYRLQVLSCKKARIKVKGAALLSYCGLTYLKLFYKILKR